MSQCDCRQMHVTSCGINSVYHHIHIWLFPNRLPETALLWWALRQSSTSMEPQFLTEGQFRNTFWAPPKFTLRTRVSYAAITQDNPRYWQPAVFSGKISPTNPAVQVAQNLAYPSSDAYLELTWALPRAAPADTNLEELESRNIIPPLGNYLLVATGGEKGALVPGRVAHQKLNLRNIGKIRPLWNSVPFVQCPSGKQPLSISQEGFLSSHSITRKILPQDWGADFFSPLDLKKTCHMLIIR